MKWTTVGATLLGLLGVNIVLGWLPSWVNLGFGFGGFFLVWTMMVWVGTIEDVRSEHEA